MILKAVTIGNPPVFLDAKHLPKGKNGPIFALIGP
jgi:hypothetical protein